MNLFDEATRSFRRFTTKDGLSNDFICAILEDDEQNLWISTNNGLTKLNIETKKCYKYVRDDGLRGNQFTHISACKTTDGMLLFGGIKGITTFYPKKIVNTLMNDTILFTELLVNNKPVRPGDETGILKQHIVKTEKLTLKSNQNVFTICFSVINFNANNHVSYLYKLEGIHKDWVDIRGNSLTFSDIAPGKYKFCVKIDPTLIENGEGHVSVLDIEILPPWWRHPLMYLVYLILLSAILIVIYKVVKGRIKIYNELRIE